MVRTRARDHGSSDQKPNPAGKSKAKSPSTKNKSDAPKPQRQSKKRGHTDEEPDAPGKADGIASPAPKKAKPSHSNAPTAKPKPIANANENNPPSPSPSKISKIIATYGTLPLSDLNLPSPSSPTPSTLLALVLHAMLTSARISHELAYRSVAALIEAGYHDLETLEKSSWEEKTQVLTRGGYTRYREKTATALGELAVGLRGEWDGDLNNIVKRAESSPTKIRDVIKGIKGIGDVGADIFFDTAQGVWPCLAPFVDPRSLKTAEQCGLGNDVDRLWQAVGKDAGQMCRLASALTKIRLEKREGEFQ